MELLRIGEKVISMTRIGRSINEILEMRASGLSQQEVGARLGIERTFISRLEGLGEIRKGQSIAAVGFPIKNKAEIENVLKDFGVEYWLLMSEKERQQFVNECNGEQLSNRIMELINRFKRYDAVIVMASDYRNRVARGMLGNQIVEMDIGRSPIREDVSVNLHQLTQVLKTIKG